jgi:cellulose synthase/poly-beta-1,6-N-acetylglucosamine synthase-like glycosyltransferase
VKPSFTIVICTFNGSNTVFNVFSYLLNLNTSEVDFEVIVVDNNSNQETKNELIRCKEIFSKLNIQLLEEPKQGKPNALIKGFNAATKDFLVICDDDNYLHKDYLINAYDIFVRHEDVGIVGGLSSLSNQENLPFWFEKFKGAWAIGTQQSKNGYVETKFPTVWGAGMVIRKVVWHDIKNLGFNSFLTGRLDSSVSMTGEDTELCIIASYLGYRIYYSDNLKITHDVNFARLNWNYYLQLNKGFSRSQIYFELYEFVFNNSSDLKFINKIWKRHLSQYIKLFYKDYQYLFFYKGIYLGFFKNVEGYEYGIVKRTYLTKIIELLMIRNKYSSYIQNLAFLHNVKK